MTIDDELILELIKPNRLGEVGDGALIVKIVGSKRIQYALEQDTPRLREQHWENEDDAEYAITHLITPDITVTLPREGNKEIAIELENDIDWDFARSLRQVKKYHSRFDDVRVLIPEDYKRFAPLYKNENFQVWLWRATRTWECLRCGSVTDKKGPVQPKCKNKKCGNNNRSEFRLVGLRDIEIEQYT